MYGTITTADTASMSIATAAPLAHWWPLKVVSNMKIEGRSLASAGTRNAGARGCCTPGTG